MLGSAIPAASVDLPNAHHSFGDALGGFFDSILTDAAAIGHDLAERGRSELVDKVYGPSESELQNASEQESNQAATQDKLLGLPTNTVLIAGGAALALVALVVILR